MWEWKKTLPIWQYVNLKNKENLNLCSPFSSQFNQAVIIYAHCGLIEHLLNFGLYIFRVQTQNNRKLTGIFVMKIVTNIFIAYITN